MPDMRQQVIAEQQELAALHQPDARGDCARCVANMVVRYPNTSITWPCGPYQMAEDLAGRLGGTVGQPSVT